jgi:hypothetical protein
MFSTVVASVLAAGGLLLAVRSIPELRRYMKMRNM